MFTTTLTGASGATAAGANRALQLDFDRIDDSTGSNTSSSNRKQAARICLRKPYPRDIRRLGSVSTSITVMQGDEQQQLVSKTKDYNNTMQRQMRNPYEYHHDLGMHLTRITNNIIVGSQPQSPADIDRLHLDHDVGAILSLQQYKDMQYWGIDIDSVVQRCKHHGILHVRKPAKDFDAQSLQRELPKAVSALERALSQLKGRTVYVHCTAGLGRAPAVVIAYLFWFNNIDLETAYNMVTSERPCGPKKDAIRGATYDLAKNDPWKAPFEHLPDYAFTGVADWERQLIQQRVRSCS